jgi:hypothetical protein
MAKKKYCRDLDHLNKTEKALLQDKDGKDKAEQEDIEHQKTNRVF